MRCKKGFTIVELMIATLVFSVAIILTTSVVIGMSKQYQKGMYTTQLNDASRTVHQDIRDSAAYSKKLVYDLDGNGNDYVCNGSVIYYWKLASGNNNQDGSRNGLYKKTLKGIPCNHSTAVENGSNILPKNGFVSKFTISISNGLYSINTKFNIGTADMFTDGTYQKCLPTLSGGDFCSIVDYNTSVIPRL